MMAWEKKVPHHKWKDELEEEKKVKDALKKAKKEAKNEDHSKECPFCYYSPVSPVPQHQGLATDHPHQRPLNCYVCPGCDRLYLVKGPGTILLEGNDVIVRHDGQ
jgi:hypothetical protein